MASEPRVSVVIPTFQRTHVIGRAVGSVLAQTFGDLEVLVINDGPADGTREVLDSLRDKRVQYLEHGRNRGISAARNSGIAAARAPRIAFLDSDDEWLPVKLEKQVVAFDGAPARVGVVYCERLSTVDNNVFHVPTPPARARSGDIHRSLLQGSMITPQTALVEARCFRECGVFDESLHHLEDWELWLRISRRFEFLFLDEPLVKVYSEAGSASQNRVNLIEALQGILIRHRDDFDSAADILATHHYYLGRLLCTQSRWSEGRREFLRAMRLDPLEPRYSVAALLSLVHLPGTR